MLLVKERQSVEGDQGDRRLLKKFLKSFICRIYL